MSMTLLISILIGFHIGCSIIVEDKEFLWQQRLKPPKVLSIIATEVTDSISFNCNNDMLTEITNPSRFRSHNCQNATSLKV